MTIILMSALVIGVIGIAIALLLNFAGDKFYVEPNEKAEQIRELLPGNNCGGCGYAGCDALAEAIAKGVAPATACPMCTNTEKIAALCGMEVKATEQKVAYVSCKGNCEKAQWSGIYFGAKDCISAKAVQQNGGKGCKSGCMGLGSCVSACVFGALSCQNGIAVVDETLCTGCGQCVKVCPNQLISLLPVSALRVSCSNPEKGMAVKQVCKAGCIGCGLCEKNCPEEAIVMENNLPVIDHGKCTRCGTCIEKCPMKVMETV
ncbi:MAG: 4Fe-4S dicluster domain-containing protein [Ruminococcaceae bacterium]|nr:4Fe-4S dicluster domain-containing protein [Oscillospiraceae bacterium]